jgi:hypothetical protein
MKKLLIAALLMVGTSAFADQETGVVFLKATDEDSVQRAVALINNDRHPTGGYFNDSCNGSRKVYAVDFTNGGYRVDRFGNLQRSGGKAIIKYSCQG